MTPTRLLAALLLLSISGSSALSEAEDRVGTGAAGAPTSTILLQNVRIFDGSTGRLTGPQDILIAGERIGSVGEDLAPAPGATTIDCTGKYAVPGLFDCHVHLAHLTTSGGDTLRSTLAEFVRRGITHVRDVGGPVELLRHMKEQVGSAALTGPEIFYAGPMLEHSPLTWERFNESLPGFTVAVDSPDAADSILDAISRNGACMTKTFFKQDTLVYRHLAAEARRRSLRIVHDPGGPLFHDIPMDMALDLGVTSIEHAKAPWPVVLKDDLRREHDALLGPAPVHGEQERMGLLMKAATMGVGSVSEDRLRWLAEQMKARDAYLCPTLLVLMTAETQAIEESKRQMGVDSLPPQALQMIHTLVGGMAAVSRHFVQQFSVYGVKMLVGQDGADPAATFAEMRALQEAGVSEAEILKGATLYPARWLDVDERLGSIAPGHEADILVLRANPLEQIAAMESTFIVVRQGRIVRN